MFVVVFAAFVLVSLRRGSKQGLPPAPISRIDPAAQMEAKGGEYTSLKEGKTAVSIKFGASLSYPDGRTKLSSGVTMKLPDKNGRTVLIEARQADLTKPPDKDIESATFTGGVTLTTSDGVVVKSADATYNDTEASAKIPGPLTFSKGRMHGKGIGATYDRNREVLWILDQAVIDVTPDDKGGGAAHMTSKNAGMARLEHYVKLTGDARLEGEGRLTSADETTLYLTDDNEKIRQMEMRGNSRITAAPGSSGGPQAMSARDIDVAYAEDGRTLQHAHLVENASVQLPGNPGQAGRRVAGRGIDIALAPDGTTVTNLTATENVQVDLPAEADIPARRIKSQTLLAIGAPPSRDQPGGLRNAVFAGNVDYRESRAANAKKNVTAINRAARSERLDVQTKPGFGDVEKADFRGRVRFTDGTDTTADAPVALYDIASDRLDLGPPLSGEAGTGPHVKNARLQVDAAHIQMTLSSQSMKADTAVRSLLQPQQDGGQGDTHVPSMLKQDKPVNVRSNRLEYDGTNSVATYMGSARLWQDDTTIQADKIVLDDKTGNLHATTGVRSIMTLTEGDKDTDKAKPQAQTGSPKPQAQTGSAKPAPAQPTTTVAEELLYEDDKHRATYTTKAHMVGPDGDVTADKIELYLAEQGGQLDRAEAYGSVVSRQATRRAYGNHLTYIAAKDEYTMVGTPVKVYDDTPPDCKLTRGGTLTFHKDNDTITSSGNEVANTKTESIVCGTVGTQD